MPKTPPGSRNLNVRLTEQMYDDLQLAARLSATSMNALITLGIEKVLDEQRADPEYAKALDAMLAVVERAKAERAARAS